MSTTSEKDAADTAEGRRSPGARKGVHKDENPLREGWAQVGMALLGLALAAVTFWGLASEQCLYDQLFAEAREATRACPGVYLAYTAALAPFRSFAFFRAAVVFLSFGFIVLGAAFVFARIRGGGTVEATGPGDAGGLKVKSAYPGVIMLALGAALVAIGLTRGASPEVSGLVCGPNPVWSKGETTGTKLNSDYALNPAPGPSAEPEEAADP